MRVDYDSTKSPTLDAFHRDDSFVRAIMGGVGSGKSVCCSMEVLLRAMQQKPDANGNRRTRFVIVRNTYGQLRDTTIATFQEWIPPELGHWKSSEHHFELDTPLGDGTRLQCEVLFRALDTPKDLRKLLSLEVTGAWFNEAREIPWSVIQLMETRVGRYPSMRDGGASWFGIWLDTNPPDTDSQFYRIFEEEKPKGYKIFKQPGGLDDSAENTANLVAGYYDRLCAGKSKDWIDIYVNAQYGFVSDGKPVFPEYVDSTHYSDADYYPETHIPIYIGIDFGLTPAATFGQQTTSGKWVIFDELVTEDCGAANFSKMLHQMLGRDYRHCKFEIFGDPAGDQRAQTDETTPFQVLRANGIEALPGPTNDPLIRLEAVRAQLQRLDFAGQPGFVITPKAKMLRKAMRGGYCYKRIMVSGGDKFVDKPDKGKYSHVADSLQYLLTGAGEGSAVVGNTGWEGQELDYSAWDRAVV